MAREEQAMSEARLAEIREQAAENDFSQRAARDLYNEVERLRALASALADADVYHADPDGFEFCGVCGSYADIDGLIHHDDDCGYFLALQWRQQVNEASEQQKGGGDGA